MDKSSGRRALGRGLDALFPPGTALGLLEADVDRIEPNPEQPRQRFDSDALAELATSIREHGIVQPLIVSSLGDERYRLIVGERRWRAARLAGLGRVPVIVKDATPQQTLELALIENLQRADLNPLEEAEVYRRLGNDFGLSHQALAQRVGKSRTAITNTLRLLTLPDTIKEAVVEGRLTEGHARALLGIPDQRTQVAVMGELERKGLNVRQTEELVRRLLEPRRKATRQFSPDLAAVESELRRVLGTKVIVRAGRKGGRVIIEYYSEEEFQGLYERLRCL
jgi:ParB family chromosome partitioning protein